MIPRRHSMEDHHHQRSKSSSNKLIISYHSDKEDNQVLDFRDVFGGPPSSVTTFCHSSGDIGITSSSSASSSKSTNAFYNDIFCHPTPHHHYSCHRGAGGQRGGIFHDDSRRMRSTNNISRNLPGFNIPSSPSSTTSSTSVPTTSERRSSSSSALKKAGLFTEEGFYDDIFGSEHGSFGSRDGKPRFCRSCKTKLIPKSNSKMSSLLAATILSSEDIQIQSDLHSNINNDMLPAAAHLNNRAQEEDVMLSSFASKLRPITIPTRTMHSESSSPPSKLSGSDGESSSGHGWTPKITLELSSIIYSPSSSEIKRSSSNIHTDSFQRYNYMKPSCGNHDHRPHFVNDNSNISNDFSAAVSPSSVTSPEFLDPLLARNVQVENIIMEKVVVIQEEYKAGGESSFIIEIDSNSHCVKSKGGTEEAAALDEVIAWAKEKFWNQQPAASDTTRSVGMKNDKTIDFCDSSEDAISIDSKQNNLPPAG